MKWIGILLIGACLWILQVLVKRWVYQRFRKSEWIQIHFGRTLILGWVFWGVCLFLLISSQFLVTTPWVYPPLLLLITGLLWVGLKEYWLGWIFVWRWNKEQGQMVQWEGKPMKVTRMRSFHLVLSDTDKQLILPYSIAQVLIVATGTTTSKKRKQHRLAFWLREDIAEQANAQESIMQFLIQQPWTLPSTPPQITLRKVDGNTEVILSISAISQQKAVDMAQMAMKAFGKQEQSKLT